MRTTRVPTERFSISSGVLPWVTPLIDTIAPEGSESTTSVPTVVDSATMETGAILTGARSPSVAASLGRRADSSRGGADSSSTRGGGTGVSAGVTGAGTIAQADVPRPDVAARSAIDLSLSGVKADVETASGAGSSGFD